MPWLLNEILSQVTPEWRYVFDPKPPVAFRSLDFVPTEEQLRIPIRIKLDEKCDKIGDYLRAPDGAYNVIVSKAFKEIIDAHDPEPHYYMPVDIEHPDGHMDSGTHFLFKMGKFIDDALIVEESVKVKKHPRFDVYQSLSATPSLMWRGSKVAGRHIWADSRLEHRVVVSDEVMTEIRAQDLSGYVAKESRINSAK